MKVKDQVVAQEGQNVNLGASAIAATGTTFNNDFGTVDIQVGKIVGGKNGDINFILLIW